MKVKFEIEKKIEHDNGKKSEKETTVTFEDVLDVKNKVKGVGAFLAKKAKETAEIAAYNVAAITANALDSVAETADTVVNAIDRFIDKNYEIVEDEIDEESCEGQCCGECCCSETCEEDLADSFDKLADELEDEENEASEDGVEDDAESDFADAFCCFLDNILSAFCDDDETSDDEDEEVEENVASDIKENPVEIFLKGVIGDVEKVSGNVIAFIKADENAKADYINKVAKRFGIKIEKTEKTSEEEEAADEDKIEKVSDDSSNADEPAEEVAPEKSIEEKVADIPEGAKYSLREFLDYMNVYNCDEKVVDPVREACIFFAAIKYPVTMYSRKAFEKATTLEKITYENVVKAIKDYFPDDSEDQILDHLHDEFDEWVASTNIKKYCPHVNFRYLLMYFVSKVRGCE